LHKEFSAVIFLQVQGQIIILDCLVLKVKSLHTIYPTTYHNIPGLRRVFSSPLWDLEISEPLGNLRLRYTKFILQTYRN